MVIFSFLLVFVEYGFAQQPDSAKQDVRIRDAASKLPVHRLCIIDGVPLPDSLYDKMFHFIDPKDVLSVTVLKAPAATAIYGAAGANGVVIIKTKSHLGAARVKGLQAYNGQPHVDTVKVKAIPPVEDQQKNPVPNSTNTKPGDPVYIVDGKEYDGDINKIDPGNTIDIVVVKDSTKASVYGPKAAMNGAVVIVTKAYAITLFQQKFSAISKKYKNYMELKHDDSKLLYVLDNTIMNIKRKSAVQQLYEIRADQIDKIEFNTDSHFANDATVVITTKDQD